MVHIRAQQRTTRKYYTIVEDMPEDIDLKKVANHLKKILKTSCSIKDNKKDGGKVILLTGDFREEIKSFLIDQGIVKEDEVTVHGF